MDTELQYDGLLEIPEEEYEEYSKRFITKEKDGKIYFPFRYIIINKDNGVGPERCYAFVSIN